MGFGSLPDRAEQIAGSRYVVQSEAEENTFGVALGAGADLLVVGVSMR
jgi:hypothetical protein